MSSTSPVREQRIYTIQCRRRLPDCIQSQGTTSHSPDDGLPRSITAAEDHFRAEDGWTLHADGTATCGSCMHRWENPPEPEEHDDAE